MVFLNRTFVLLTVKVLATATVGIAVLFYIDGNPLSSVLLVSILISTADYLLGDLWVLPAYGNSSASLFGGIVTAATVFAYSVLFPGFHITFTTVLLVAMLVTIVEYLIHVQILMQEIA